MGDDVHYSVPWAPNLLLKRRSWVERTNAIRTHSAKLRWLGEERTRAGISTLRGAMSPESGRAEDGARKNKIELEERGLGNEPLGADMIVLPVLFCSAKGRHQGNRWPAAHAECADDQDTG
jgi:hypothetical protein